MNLDTSCGTCKFMIQGEGCCFCANPNQTDNELIRYVYYNFSCSLQCKADKLSEKDLIDLGYKKYFQELEYTDGTKGGYYFYKK